MAKKKFTDNGEELVNDIWEKRIVGAGIGLPRRLYLHNKKEGSDVKEAMSTVFEVMEKEARPNGLAIGGAILGGMAGGSFGGGVGTVLGANQGNKLSMKEDPDKYLHYRNLKVLQREMGPESHTPGTDSNKVINRYIERNGLSSDEMAAMNEAELGSIKKGTLKGRVLGAGIGAGLGGLVGLIGKAAGDSAQDIATETTMNKEAIMNTGFGAVAGAGLVGVPAAIYAEKKNRRENPEEYIPHRNTRILRTELGARRSRKAGTPENKIINDYIRSQGIEPETMEKIEDKYYSRTLKPMAAGAAVGGLMGALADIDAAKALKKISSNGDFSMEKESALSPIIKSVGKGALVGGGLMAGKKTVDNKKRINRGKAVGEIMGNINYQSAVSSHNEYNKKHGLKKSASRVRNAIGFGAGALGGGYAASKVGDRIGSYQTDKAVMRSMYDTMEDRAKTDGVKYNRQKSKRGDRISLFTDKDVMGEIQKGTKENSNMKTAYDIVMEAMMEKEANIGAAIGGALAGGSFGTMLGGMGTAVAGSRRAAKEDPEFMNHAGNIFNIESGVHAEGNTTGRSFADSQQIAKEKMEEYAAANDIDLEEMNRKFGENRKATARGALFGGGAGAAAGAGIGTFLAKKLASENSAYDIVMGVMMEKI